MFLRPGSADCFPVIVWKRVGCPGFLQEERLPEQVRPMVMQVDE